MTTLLAVDDLRVQFRTEQGAAQAVDGVSFTIHAGETLCVVGESGCGKSVTALAIMGLLPRLAANVAGRVVFEGRDLLRLDQGALADLRGNRLAMIFQEPMTSLNPAFTVGSQLTEVLVRHRGASAETARRAAIDMLRHVRI
ncbi:MAG TPA: ATP-binding cassette domain-containing protein, partial [Burkholderiaceae bacterium]|nr:ATP-binding cassette domain-containing protein [Burkholderiaceae bacterium]